MEELATTYLNPQQVGMVFKLLQFGGYIKVSERLGIKVDKSDVLTKIAITVTGQKIDNKVYFGNMQSSYVKKTTQKKPKRGVSKTETKASEVDLFDI